jgi:hypothetical protein
VIDVFKIKSVRLENDHDVMYMYKLPNDYMTSGAGTSIKYQLECKVNAIRLSLHLRAALDLH